MKPTKVLLDTNVLFSFYLRDLILTLAENNLIEFVWSKSIKDELKSSLVRSKRLSIEKIDRLIAKINSAFPNSLQIDSKSPIIPYGCKDENDEHVFHTAISSLSEAIITFDIFDFPDNAKEKFGVEILTPDDFLSRIYEINKEEILKIIDLKIALYSSPSMDFSLYCEVMDRLNCQNFSQALRDIK